MDDYLKKTYRTVCKVKQSTLLGLFFNGKVTQNLCVYQGFEGEIESYIRADPW